MQVKMLHPTQQHEDKVDVLIILRLLGSLRTCNNVLYAPLWRSTLIGFTMSVGLGGGYSGFGELPDLPPTLNSQGFL